MLWNALLGIVSAKALKVTYKINVSKKPFQRDALNQATLTWQALASVNGHDAV